MLVKRHPSCNPETQEMEICMGRQSPPQKKLSVASCHDISMNHIISTKGIIEVRV